MKMKTKLAPLFELTVGRVSNDNCGSELESSNVLVITVASNNCSVTKRTANIEQKVILIVRFD